MLPMKPRVVRTVLLCCLALLLMPVEAFAVSYVSNISVQDGVLSFTYERPEMPPDKTIVRFDLSFHAGSSSTEHGSAKYIAWAKANTGSYANYTSQGVTISLNGDTFTITVNFTTLRPYEGDSFQLDGLTAPNTHLWMRCAPCHDGSDEGLEQYVEWLYLGEFGSWQELSQSDYRIGNTYYKTLDDALAAAKANDTIEILANPTTQLTPTRSLADGVTLKTPSGSTYTSQGGATQFQVDTDGTVTVQSTGTGVLSCSAGQCKVAVGNGEYKTVSCEKPYTVAVPGTGSSYITGVAAGTAVEMDSVQYIAPGGGTSGKIYLPDPLAASEGCTEARIESGKEASVLLEDNTRIQTHAGTNTDPVIIKKESEGNVLELPPGASVSAGNKSFSNSSTDSLLIHLGLEDYKEDVLDQVSQLDTTTASEAVKKIIADAMAAIEKLRYDETKSLAQNKKAIDDILAQLQKDLKAAQANKNNLPTTGDDSSPLALWGMLLFAAVGLCLLAVFSRKRRHPAEE